MYQTNRSDRLDSPDALRFAQGYPTGHIPPGQPPPLPHMDPAWQESQAGELGWLCPTANPDISFVTSVPPHFSQVRLVALRLF